MLAPTRTQFEREEHAAEGEKHVAQRERESTVARVAIDLYLPLNVASHIEPIRNTTCAVFP